MTNNNFNFTPAKTLYARRMRFHPTSAEQKLWQLLSSKKIGYRFRRQVTLLGFIADFYCPELKLIIEADGLQHTWNDRQRAYDVQRDLFLERNGYVVLRVPNQDIFINIPAVLTEILRIGYLIGRLANPN
jgi:very-short-patch-repair endonuclease